MRGAGAAGCADMLDSVCCLEVWALAGSLWCREDHQILAMELVVKLGAGSSVSGRSDPDLASGLQGTTTVIADVIVKTE